MDDVVTVGANLWGFVRSSSSSSLLLLSVKNFEQTSVLLWISKERKKVGKWYTTPPLWPIRWVAWLLLSGVDKVARVCWKSGHLINGTLIELHLKLKAMQQQGEGLLGCFLLVLILDLDPLCKVAFLRKQKRRVSRAGRNTVLSLGSDHGYCIYYRCGQNKQQDLSLAKTKEYFASHQKSSLFKTMRCYALPDEEEGGGRRRLRRRCYWRRRERVSSQDAGLLQWKGVNFLDKWCPLVADFSRKRVCWIGQALRHGWFSGVLPPAVGISRREWKQSAWKMTMGTICIVLARTYRAS